MDSLIVTENVSPEERRALDIALYLSGEHEPIQDTLTNIAKACHLRDEDAQAALETLVDTGVASDCIRLGSEDRKYTLSEEGEAAVNEYKKHHEGLMDMNLDFNTMLHEYARLAGKLRVEIPAILKPKTE